LLPCSCGEKTAIEPRQAGQTVTCRCGASLEVPTLLQMRRLEAVPPEAGVRRAAAPSWGLYHSLIFLGSVITIAALGVGTWLVVIRPQPVATPPTPEQIRAAIDQASATATWLMWKGIRRKGLDLEPPAEFPDYPKWLFHYRIWMGVTSVFALGGIALIGYATLSLRRRTARARPPSSP